MTSLIIPFLLLIQSEAVNNSTTSGQSEAKDPLADANEHERIAQGFLLMTTILSISMTLSLLVDRRGIKMIGSAAIATTFGLLCGLFLKLFKEEIMLKSVLEMDDSLFFYLLLPPIIFEGGFSIERNVFLKNVGTTIWLAVWATLLTFLFLSGGMFLAGQLQLCTVWSMRECLGFAAVVSATDPVTILAILRNVLEGTGNPGLELLYMLIAGESLLNDAICLVLYRSIIQLGNNDLIDAMGEFLVVFAASCAMGIAVAALSALLFKVCKIAKADGSSAPTEVAIMTLFVWISYLLPEALELSGICAILFAGVFMKKYTYTNLSETGQHVAHGIFAIFATLAESTTFVFLGIAPFSFSSALSATSISVYVMVLILAFSSRYFAVSSTVGIANIFRKRNTIPENYTRVLQLCGFRGSMALALGIRAKMDFPEHGDQILASTIVLGLSTVLGLGTVAPKLMNMLLADAPYLPGATGEGGADANVVSGYGGSLKKALVKVNNSVLESTLTVRSHKRGTFDDAKALFAAPSVDPPSPAVIGQALRNSHSDPSGLVAQTVEINTLTARSTQGPHFEIGDDTSKN